MSGFPVKPPSTESGLYNPSFYTAETDYLTLAEADLTYTKLNDSRLNSLSVITGVTAGTAAASKALVLDANRSVGNINALGLFTNSIAASASNFANNYNLLIKKSTTTSGDRAGIAFMTTTTANDATVPAGSLVFERTGTNGIGDFIFAMRAGSSDTTLSNIMRLSQIGYVKINDANIGAGAGTKLEADGAIRSNTTSGSFGIMTGDGTSTAFMGPDGSNSRVQFGSTNSSHNIGIYAGGAVRYQFGSNGYISIGSTVSNYPLNIAISQIDNVTSYGVGTPSGYFSNQTNANYYISLRCVEAVTCRAIVTRSDRRLKKNFKPIYEQWVEDFIEKVEPQYYELKKGDTPELGYAAQDIVKYLPHGSITYDMPSEGELPIEQEGDTENRIFGVQYQRIVTLLHAEIKNLRKRLDDLSMNPAASKPKRSTRSKKSVD